MANLRMDSGVVCQRSSASSEAMKIHFTMADLLRRQVAINEFETLVGGMDQ